MADVCRLEDTKFVKGIKTEDHGSSTFSEDSLTPPDYVIGAWIGGQLTSTLKSSGRVVV